MEWLSRVKSFTKRTLLGCFHNGLSRTVARPMKLGRQGAGVRSRARGKASSSLPGRALARDGFLPGLCCPQREAGEECSGAGGSTTGHRAPGSGNCLGAPRQVTVDWTRDGHLARAGTTGFSVLGILTWDAIASVSGHVSLSWALDEAVIRSWGWAERSRNLSYVASDGQSCCWVPKFLSQLICNLALATLSVPTPLFLFSWLEWVPVLHVSELWIRDKGHITCCCIGQ